MKIIARGRIEDNGDDNGRLHIYRRNQFLKDIQVFLGKEVVISVEKFKKKRSLEQNAYLWGYVYKAVQDGLKDITGEKYTISQIHEMFKSEFLGKEIVNEKTGETIKIPGTTTTLSTSGMMDFIAEITKWSAEWLGIVILEPGEQARISY